jgi:hypothetical protein
MVRNYRHGRIVVSDIVKLHESAACRGSARLHDDAIALPTYSMAERGLPDGPPCAVSQRITTNSYAGPTPRVVELFVEYLTGYVDLTYNGEIK